MRRREFLKGTLVAGVGSTATAGCATTPGSPAVVANGARGQLNAFDLQCESRRDPLGIDALRPRLSWKLRALGGARDQAQSAYRVSVASTSALLASGVADLWDSGTVVSPRQLDVEYDGLPLGSSQRLFWQVQVWDSAGNASVRSTPAWWEMGLLSASDWTGFWISDGSAEPENEEAFYEDDPAPLFRRIFQVDRPVKSARLYAAGLGYCEMRMNGQPVSDNALDPAWTSFADRVYYTSEDVTDRLSVGENVLGAMLGNGWYNPLPLRMWGRINIRENLAVGRPRLMAQLVIEYKDGSTQSVATDETWRFAPGPIVRNSVYLGETYDARLEQTGWDAPGFEDSGWIHASRAGAADSKLGSLVALPIPPIRVTATLKPVGVSEPKPGVFVFDLGQNFAGWVRLRVQGPRGTKVIMRMGERIYDNGTLNGMTAVAGQIKGLRADGTPRGGPGAPEIAWQSNTYTLRGGQPEAYTPRFTFHGFRYVEVTGYPGRPTLDAVEGLRLNTDVATAGTFACSNPRLNQIHDMVRWTLLSNLFSVQSDCPAREKFQYGGDIVASSEMAMLNYDMATFYAKAVSDHRDAIQGQGWFTETAPFVGISAENYAEGAGPIGWSLAHPLLVAQLYQYYGDRRVVEEHFEPARRWVDLLERNADGFVVDRCIGDHESLDPKPIELIATAQFYQAASLVAGFASVLGLPDHEARYRLLAENIRRAFVARFLERGTGRFGIATQAAQAAALYLGLVPEGEIEAATQRMVDQVVLAHNGHIATGIFGTKYLLNALSRAGHADVAYGMVDTPAYPGWGFMLANGATTLWETWAESDNVYSQNHPMFGSVSEWFYKSAGGIRPAEEAVGFDRFRIEPDVVVGLEWVVCSYESVRGTIKSNWRLEGDVLHLTLDIPANTTAMVRIPTSDSSSAREGGLPIAQVSPIRRLQTTTADALRVELGSGQYVFTVPAP